MASDPAPDVPSLAMRIRGGFAVLLNDLLNINRRGWWWYDGTSRHKTRTSASEIFFYYQLLAWYLGRRMQHHGTACCREQWRQSQARRFLPFGSPEIRKNREFSRFPSLKLPHRCGYYTRFHELTPDLGPNITRNFKRRSVNPYRATGTTHRLIVKTGIANLVTRHARLTLKARRRHVRGRRIRRLDQGVAMASGSTFADTGECALPRTYEEAVRQVWRPLAADGGLRELVRAGTLAANSPQYPALAVLAC